MFAKDGDLGESCVCFFQDKKIERCLHLRVPHVPDQGSFLAFVVWSRDLQIDFWGYCWLYCQTLKV